MLYLVKPVRDEENGIWHTDDCEWPESQSMPLGENFIQEVSWEDEPVCMDLTRVNQKISREVIEDVVVCMYSWNDMSRDWVRRYGLPSPVGNIEYIYDCINGNIDRWLKLNGWKSYIMEDYISWKIKSNDEVRQKYKRNCEIFEQLKIEGDERIIGIGQYFNFQLFDEKRKESVYKNFD